MNKTRGIGDRKSDLVTNRKRSVAPVTYNRRLNVQYRTDITS